MVNFEDARMRNIMMKITNAVVNDGLDLEMSFSEKDKREKMYLKQSDIMNFEKKIFDGDKIRDEIKIKVIKNLEKHNEKIDSEKVNKFKAIYLELCDNIENFHDDMIKNKMEEATQLAIELHWKYIPVYFEQYIVNNGVLPEDKLEYYYNHFHAIEDLYRYIFTTNKVDWRSIEGDINLNKPMNFKVYTTRWGHYDNYTISRTVNGWYVEHMIAENGDSKKNGEGSLFKKLDHDSVFYPEEGIKYALEILWNEADTTEMSVKVLQDKLNDIASWIEAVEKATKEHQPNWCSYY